MSSWRRLLFSVGKTSAGGLLAAADPRCRFDRCLFVLGHMRCGSTALSSILCARPEISGYGETHIAYRGPAALGTLSLNLRKHGAWHGETRFLFDKILHNRYDIEPPAEFFASRAIFVVREPDTTIRSIRTLFAKIGSPEYASDAEAADYYSGRLDALETLWRRYPAPRRLGFTYGQLTSDTAATLAKISELIEFSSPLQNVYDARALRSHHGAGDPLAAAQFNRIVGRETEDQDLPPLELAAGRMTALRDQYERISQLFTVR